MSDEVSEERRREVEEVRAHLVALRGGAPFLSPDDASLLLRWLDEGVGVPTIVRALERAHDARRKRRTRAQLALRHARTHLAKATRGALQPLPASTDRDHPLTALTQVLRTQAQKDPRGEALEGLVTTLERLPSGDGETLLRGALGAVRDFFRGAWEQMPASERDDRVHRARDALRDLAGMVDEPAFEAAVDEAARDGLRRDYPLLTAATLWDLVHR